MRPEEIGLRPVVCIAGPTASGKSGLAVELAEAVDGEVVNADALQVYGDIAVLSARPDTHDMQSVPHHLFGHVDGRTPYSVGDWLREAVPVTLDILARHRVPIVVGGTGLYFKALLQGLADIPPVPDALEAELNAMSVNDLRAEADVRDPQAASRVLGADPQRLARIVGVARATGRTLTDWRADTRPVIPARYVRRVVLLPDRAGLYARIDSRFDAMMQSGALEEAKAVNARDYPDRASLPKAIGLSHLLSHLRGQCDLAKAVDLAKRDSRRLAKRQSTWFRNQCADWPVVQTPQERAEWLSATTGRL